MHRRVTRALIAAAAATAALAGAAVAPAAAHYDRSCRAYPYVPNVSGDEISAFGYGSCEDENGHYQHQMLCARTRLQKRTSDGTFTTVSDPTPHTCQYDASHVGDSSWEFDDWCADGSATRYAGVFRTRIHFWARNEAGQKVHERRRSSDPRSIHC